VNWTLFLLVAALVVVGLDTITLHFRTRLEAFDSGRWRFPQWLESQERYRQRANPAPPSLLFLGDSSIAYGIRPSLVDRNAFSLARQALRTCELEALDVKLQRLLKGRPKAIVIGFLWFGFLDLDQEAGGTPAARPSMSRFISQFYDRPQLGQQFLPGARLGRQAVDAELEDLRTRQRNFFVVAPDGNVEVPDGKPPSWTVATPDQLAETRVGWFGPGRLLQLQSFVQGWRTRGVPVFFVFMPLHPGFRATYDRALGQDNRRWRAGVTELFEGQIIDMEDTLQDPRYYSDAMHLNKEGSVRFSLLLRDRMREMPLGFPLNPAQPEGHSGQR
jgi:hypothetical protein